MWICSRIYTYVAGTMSQQDLIELSLFTTTVLHLTRRCTLFLSSSLSLSISTAVLTTPIFLNVHSSIYMNRVFFFVLVEKLVHALPITNQQEYVSLYIINQEYVS